MLLLRFWYGSLVLSIYLCVCLSVAGIYNSKTARPNFTDFPVDLAWFSCGSVAIRYILPVCGWHHVFSSRKDHATCHVYAVSATEHDKHNSRHSNQDFLELRTVGRSLLSTFVLFYTYGRLYFRKFMSVRHARRRRHVGGWADISSDKQRRTVLSASVGPLVKSR